MGVAANRVREFGGGIARGFGRECRTLFGVRRFQIMLVLLFVMSWAAIDVYREMVVAGLPVAIVDRDNSKISRTLRQFVAANREVALVEAPVQTLAEAEDLLLHGRISAVLYIPESFSADIKKGRKGSLILAVDMSNIVIGKNLYKAISKSVSTVAGGVQLTVVKKFGEQKDRALAKVLPIAVNESYAFNPGANYGVYVIPPLLFFFLHIFVLILAVSVYLPADKPDSTAGFLGAFAAIFAAGFLVGMVFFYIFLPLENLPPESGFGVLASNLAAFLALDLVLAAAFNAVLPFTMMAFEATIVFGMLSLMFCGLTWPTDAFPPLIRWVAGWIPFTPFARGLRIALHYPATLPELHAVFAQYGVQAAVGLLAIAGGAAVRAIWRRRAIGGTA